MVNILEIKLNLNIKIFSKYKGITIQVKVLNNKELNYEKVS